MSGDVTAYDACWHCGDCIEPEPHPHCVRCPPFEQCDGGEDCTEPGCNGETFDTAAALALTCARARIAELERARQAWCEEATAHLQTVAGLKRSLNEERNAHRVAYAGLLARCGQLERGQGRGRA